MSILHHTRSISMVCIRCKTDLCEDLNLLKRGIEAVNAANGHPPDTHRRAHCDAAGQRELEHTLPCTHRSIQQLPVCDAKVCILLPVPFDLHQYKCL